jgi:hypothetical protein
MLTYQRIASLMNDQVYIEVLWDDPQIDEETGVPADPTATYLIHAVVYQNLSSITRHAQVGGRVYDIPAGTPRTERNLTNPQRTRLDAVPTTTLY